MEDSSNIWEVLDTEHGRTDCWIDRQFFIETLEGAESHDLAWPAVARLHLPKVKTWDVFIAISILLREVLERFAGSVSSIAVRAVPSPCIVNFTHNQKLISHFCIRVIAVVSVSENRKKETS